MSVPTVDSLPPVPQMHLQEMQKEADKRMAADGIVQEVEQEVQETEETPIEQVAAPAAKADVQMESEQAKNFRAVREAKDTAIRERDEAYRLIREIEAQKNAQPPEDLDFSLGADELAEGKHLSKVQKKMKALEDQVRNYQVQAKALEMNLMLNKKYTDFEQVMSNENIEKLEQLEPEVAAALISSSNPYAARVTAYKFIKNLGIAQDETMVKDHQRAQGNAAKPKPLASVASQQGTSPLSKANAFENGLTEELAKQLRAEMVAAMKNR